MLSIQTGFIRAAFVFSGGLGLFAAAFVVQAQETPARASADQLEMVVVTGSRIQRRDYEANSPILTVDESLFKNSSTAAIEANLTKLPQFHAVQTPTTGAGDIQPTPTNSPGAATVSLRGLGANRNLVLIDGRRATPGNASQVVDINTIPQLAIERVETITGGASSTYGADAVSGVVNFIMKKDFEGFQLDAMSSQTGEGDGDEYQVTGLVGANVADGRGNVMLALSTNRRDGSKRIDRDWYNSYMRDTSVAGDEFFPTFSGYDPATFTNVSSQAVLDGIFSEAAPGSISPFTRLYFNPDGTAFTGFFQSFAPAGVYRFTGDLTGTKWKKTDDGLLNQNFQDTGLVIPLERDNIYARGNYEINEYFGFFAQGLFSKVETRTVQQPSPSVNGWAAFIPVDGRDIPPELAAILASRPDPTGVWRLTYYLDYANRDLRADGTTYNLLAGFQGEIPAIDWTWEAYGSKGESVTSALTTGVASLERFRAVVSAPDWGKGFDSRDFGYSNPAFGGFGANFATCTSGIDPFHKELPISQDCLDAISASLKTRATMQQDIWEANAQGKLFDWSGGEVRAAIGATYRQTKYEFLNDTLTSQGVAFNDQAIGIYPSGDASGEDTVTEYYGELLVPLLKDLPLAHVLELELGARSSDYDTTGSSTTYKAMANWGPSSWLRVRGGFNRAERSPNIGELYLAPSQTFQIGAAGDLCSIRNPSPFSANPATNPNAAEARALCEALMERAAPGTAATFYANPQFSEAVGITFAFPSVTGNPDLTTETADTWTVGLVFDSPFEAEILQNLRLSIDYWNIKVEDAIGPQSVDVAQRQCFDPAFNPSFDVNSIYCAGIGRVANDGALGDIRLTYFNNGRFETSGIDLQIDWAFDLGPGQFTLNSIVSYLDSLKSAELDSDPLVEWAGSLGPNQNELNAGAFDWKMFNTVGYTVNRWYVALQWQHLPSIKSISYPTNPNTTLRGADAYDLLGLLGSFAITDDVVVRFGVENLFDEDPPLLERNSAPPPGLLPGGDYGGDNQYSPTLYDFIGRRFYLAATVKF